MNRLTVYRALDKCFPRSYRLKIFAIAFVGTHVPLLAATGWALNGGFDAAEHVNILLSPLNGPNVLAALARERVLAKASLTGLYTLNPRLAVVENDCT